MYVVERRNKILNLLNEKKSLSVQDTALIFGVAEETIRRDLNVLEKQELLIRTHGGAVVIDTARHEISYERRKSINITGKDKIGAKAAKLINHGDIIILDASTSAFCLAKKIKETKGITVITNAQNIIVELSGAEGIELISTGGNLRRKSMSYVGRIAETALENYHATKLFFSCMGFSLERGITDSNGQESDMKKMMLRRSQKAYLLCDHTKFDKVGYASTAKETDIHALICDEPLTDSVHKNISALGIEIFYA